MGNYYSYKRLSTDQKHQSYNRQDKALHKYAVEHKISFLIEFAEEKSGKNFSDRSEFMKLDRILQTDDTVVFKDLYLFTRGEVESGYQKYMEWLDRGIHMVFIDNPVMCSDYIRQMLRTAAEQDIVTRTAMEGTVKLLMIVELDRGQQQRLYISQSIKDGIHASNKRSGRKPGQLDKLTDTLQRDIMLYLSDRSVSQTSLMKKHGVSRNTLKKYIAIVQKGKSV